MAFVQNVLFSVVCSLLYLTAHGSPTSTRKQENQTPTTRLLTFPTQSSSPGVCTCSSSSSPSQITNPQTDFKNWVNSQNGLFQSSQAPPLSAGSGAALWPQVGEVMQPWQDKVVEPQLHQMSGGAHPWEQISSGPLPIQPWGSNNPGSLPIQTWGSNNPGIVGSAHELYAPPQIDMSSLVSYPANNVPISGMSGINNIPLPVIYGGQMHQGPQSYWHLPPQLLKEYSNVLNFNDQKSKKFEAVKNEENSGSSGNLEEKYLEIPSGRNLHHQNLQSRFIYA